MSPEKAAAERAGDVDRVADVCTAAHDRFDPGAAAEDGDGHGELAVPRRGVAADDGEVEGVRGGFHAGEKLLRILDVAVARERDRRDGGGGKAGHRGAIRQVAVHHLAADVQRRVDGGVEVHAVENLVDADDEQV